MVGLASLILPACRERNGGIANANRYRRVRSTPFVAEATLPISAVEAAISPVASPGRSGADSGVKPQSAW